MRDEFLIRVPAEYREEFEDRWESARRSENLSVAYVLTEPQPVSGFTGVEVVEWIPQILEHSPAIMTAVFGYLVSRRNVEIVFEDMKFKNLSADKLGQVLEMIRRHQSKTDTSASLTPHMRKTATTNRSRKTSRKRTSYKTSQTKASRKTSPKKTGRKTLRKKTSRR